MGAMTRNQFRQSFSGKGEKARGDNVLCQGYGSHLVCQTQPRLLDPKRLRLKGGLKPRDASDPNTSTTFVTLKLILMAGWGSYLFLHSGGLLHAHVFGLK